MARKLLILISLAATLAITGCIKEYNMDTLLGNGHLSPTFGISAIRGNISLSDIKSIPNDTVIFDEDKFIRFVYRKDSVIEFKMSEYYDLNDMVSFNESYAIGEISLAPFSGSIFPITTAGEIPFPVFNNFENATLSQGALDITVKNNTTAVINNITITIYNNSPRQQLGNPAVISAINPGKTGTSSINLADLTIIRNHTSAAFVISGGPGMTLNGSNLEISMTGRDMKVKSGRIIIPAQMLPSLKDDHIDTVELDPGDDVEITLIKMTAGKLSYTINNSTPLKSTISLTLLTGKIGNDTISELFTINPGLPLSGNISLDNSTINLGSVASHPYNMLPVEYLIEISSQNNLVNFRSTDEISLDLSLLNPNFDYVKGYFGKKTETIEEDNIDLKIEETLNKITGEFLFSNPSITLNYKNSFALPIKIDLQAKGYRKTKTQSLNLAPFFFRYPAAPVERDKDTLFTINSINSDLAELVSMPPEKIIYSGSAVMNPNGNNGKRDNYIFGDSRFIGDLEIEVPLEFSLNNIQFTHTTKNFLQTSDSSDSPIRPEDFQFMRIDLDAENGFPLGVSVSMILYDTLTSQNVDTLNSISILEPAEVDANGRVTQPKSCSTKIEIDRKFWSSIDVADKIIFCFTLNTTDGGTKNVKIYSDYGIDFKATLVLKPDIKFDLKRTSILLI
ncbi:MAG: hypothetical protein NT092_00605 [Bacteroidia bacterium]|nr:hypothetical protein [Bacteroidia bacterium]